MELYAFKKNNFILNKLLPCLLITMFAFMCLYGSSVFAVSPTVLTYNQESHYFTYNNQEYTINDDIFTMPFLLFFETSGERFTTLSILASSEPFYFASSGDDYYNVRNSVNTTFYFETFDYRYPSILQGLTTKTLSDYSNSSSDTGLYVGGFQLTSDSILFLNFDIYDFNNQDELVFQGAPQPTLLAGIVEQQEMKPLQEILGILPVVIVVLVSLIAIRKGILFLMARMKKA